MLTYFLVKSESIKLLDMLEEAFLQEINSDPELDLNSVRKLMVEGIRVLDGRGGKSIPPNLLYVRKGYMSRELFNRVYPENNGENGIDSELRNRFLNQPYGLVVMEIPSEFRGRLREEVRGKMATPEKPGGVGARGRMRNIFISELTGLSPLESEVALPKGRNFIHFPDSEDEAREVYSYLHSSKGEQEDGFVLYDKEEARPVEPNREMAVSSEGKG